MTHDEIDLRFLARLPAATPDLTRSERVRARCRAVLTRPGSAERHAQARRPARRLIESTLVAAFGLVYLSAVVLEALRTQDVLK